MNTFLGLGDKFEFFLNCFIYFSASYKEESCSSKFQKNVLSVFSVQCLNTLANFEIITNNYYCNKNCKRVNRKKVNLQFTMANNLSGLTIN